MAESVPSFKVECPDCSMAREANEFDEVATFADKHAEHTDHEVTWVRADFGIEYETSSEWTLRCDTCDELWRFESERRARAYRQEHAEFTDHEISNPPNKETVEFPQDVAIDEIRSVIASMEDKFENGVPEQAIYACFAGEEDQLPTVRASIEELRQKGEIYEPARGALRTV